MDLVTVDGYIWECECSSETNVKVHVGHKLGLRYNKQTLYACGCACACVFVCVCMCVCIRVCVHVHSCVCMEKKDKEWVHVLFLPGFTHRVDKQSIPIKASCSPGDCALSDHIIFWKTPEWLIVIWRKQNHAGTASVVWEAGEGWGWVADWLQVSPERYSRLVKRGRRSEEGEAINSRRRPSLPLLLHVGLGDKLIMWLRLIRWCWGKFVTVKL